MYQKKKERLYISELLDDPSVTYLKYFDDVSGCFWLERNALHRRYL